MIKLRTKYFPKKHTLRRTIANGIAEFKNNLKGLNSVISTSRFTRELLIVVF